MGGLFGGGSPATISTSEPRVGAMRIQTSSYGMAIPLIYGRQRISGNLIWYGDFTPIAHTTTQTTGGKGGGGGVTQSNTTYTYQTALMIGLCEGPIVSIGYVWKGKTRYNSLAASGGMTLKAGNVAQAVWSWLTSKHPSQAIGYSGLAYVAHGSYDLKSSPQLDNHSFEVRGQLQYSGAIYDCDPSDVVSDFLSNAYHGAGFPAAQVADLTDFSNYCIASGLFISPAMTEQRPAIDWLRDMVQSVNCDLVTSGGSLRVVPYGDTAVTGNSVTWTPSLTPQYDLTDDDFLDHDRPVLCRRTPAADAFNCVQIEYLDRNNDYNVAIMEVKDQASIEQFGLRQEDVQKMHHICDATVAQKVAQARLQRLLYIRNEYEFTIGWNYCRLEPMDIVTLTDAWLGLDRFPVRLYSTEENDIGDIRVVARELPIGVADPAIFDSETAAGFSTGWDAAPGNVNAPLLFEPSLELTGGGNEVWVAVSGGADWGGCSVWISLDNATYERIGAIYGSARYGTLNTAIAAPTADPDTTNTLTVDLNTDEQILASSQAAVDAFASLCYVGGELLAYRDATLITSRRYALDYLRRGLYGSTSGSHLSGAQFARLDQAIFRHAYNAADIGQTVYLKFTSFNAFGLEEQDLASVTAYNRTLTGGVPSGPANLSLQHAFVGLEMVVQWSPVTGAGSYDIEIWSGGVLRDSYSTTATTFTYTLDNSILDGGPWRDYTVKVRAVSGAQVSGWSQLNASNPTPVAPTGITPSSDASSITLSWTAIADVDLQDYQAHISTTSGFTPDATSLAYTGTVAGCTITGLPGATTHYLLVTARDKWGAATLVYSSEITQATL